MGSRSFLRTGTAASPLQAAAGTLPCRSSSPAAQQLGIVLFSLPSCSPSPLSSQKASSDHVLLRQEHVLGGK